MDPKWSTLTIFSKNRVIFGFLHAMSGGPQSEKKVHHQVSFVGPVCGTPKRPFWNINMATIYKNVKSSLEFHEKMAVFSHYLAMNGKFWV